MSCKQNELPSRLSVPQKPVKISLYNQEDCLITLYL